MRPWFQWWSGKGLVSEEINKMLDNYKCIIYRYISIGNGIALNQCFPELVLTDLCQLKNMIDFQYQLKVCWILLVYEIVTPVTDPGSWPRQKRLHCSLRTGAYSKSWRIWSFALSSGKGIRKGMLIEHSMISKEKESCNFCIVLRLGCCLAKCWESLASAKTKLQVSSVCHRPLQVTV